METDNNSRKPVLVIPAPPAPTDPKPTQKLQKEELVEYTESELVRHARKIVPRMFKSLQRRLELDDSKAYDQAAQTYGFIKTSPGIALNILTQNNSYGGDGEIGFEKIVRQLERRDRPENDASEAILDAEVVEDDE